MTIQEIIEREAKKLSNAYNLYKDWKSTLKDLKKELSSQLKSNPEWVELQEKSKLLKVNRKEISEQIKELEKSMDQIASWLEEYKVVEDFKNSMDEKYNDQIDQSLNNLSRELTEKWIVWEVEYKNWKLFLVVAKH